MKSLYFLWDFMVSRMLKKWAFQNANILPTGLKTIKLKAKLLSLRKMDEVAA